MIDTRPAERTTRAGSSDGPPVGLAASREDGLRIEDAVGSGPGGPTIAAELTNSALCVLVVENHGCESSYAVDALDDYENVGARRARSPSGDRILGGNPHTWSGRWVLHDELDFRARPCVPGSEWPIDPGDHSTLTIVALAVRLADHRVGRSCRATARPAHG
ncbi:hypothetical protein [Nocardia amikacinitolerans]|uniref:hypothetical protein n=1 Tax=Nocardia amikacinitolerans TaxID=756689 RepID=UPI0020A3003B|nr:hypothetical protein [Nocardia amikacinitolerans]MCP2292133.1 hypothetical protein [Nocardia amikacinitolerans]